MHDGAMGTQSTAGTCGAQFTVQLNAPEGSVFAPDAFAGQVGDIIAVNHESGSHAYAGTIVAVRVSEDGSYAEFTAEVPAGTIPGPPLGGMSIQRATDG